MQSPRKARQGIDATGTYLRCHRHHHCHTATLPPPLPHTATHCHTATLPHRHTAKPPPPPPHYRTFRSFSSASAAAILRIVHCEASACRSWPLSWSCASTSQYGQMTAGPEKTGRASSAGVQDQAPSSAIESEKVVAAETGATASPLLLLFYIACWML
eukprot:3007582-Prymnesium_polylepis.1